MIKLLMKFRLTQKILLWMPAALATYIPFAAVSFGEHSIGQQLGITAASILLLPSIGTAVASYKIKGIPKNWTINLINETSMREGRSYVWEIRDEYDEVIFPSAQAKNGKPFPVLALIAAAHDCELLRVAQKRGEVESLKQGRKPIKLMGDLQLEALNKRLALPEPEEEEVVDASIDGPPRTGRANYL